MKKKTISNMEDLLTCGYFDYEEFYRNGKWELDEELIGKYLKVLPLAYIFKFQKMSEKFLNNHFDYLSNYMGLILETHELPEYMLEKILESYKSRGMENLFWNILPIHQKLSMSFVERHEDEINWESFSMYQKIDDPDFVNEYMDRISWINVKDNIKMTEEAFIEKYTECDPDVFRFQKFSKEFIKNLNPLILDYFFEFDEDEWEGFDIDRSWMNLLIYRNMDCEFFEEWWENIKSKDEFISALIRFNELSEEFMDAHWNELSEIHLNLIPLYQKFSLDFYHKHKFDLDAGHNIGWRSFEKGEIPPEVSFDNLY